MHLLAGLVLGATLLAAEPGERLGGTAMRVPPLPPTWTAPSEPTRHAEDDLPADLGKGDRAVRAQADRAGLACLEELRRLRVPFRREQPVRGIATPVTVTGPVRGLRLTPRWGKKPALMDCRFALTLYRVARVVLASGVNELLYSSFYSYRTVARSRWLSRHAFGLAVDVFEVRGPQGLQADVKRDWVKVVGRPGDCVGGVSERKARALRLLACSLEKSGHVHLVLTPDSDHAHRDHLHISGFREGERQGPRYRWAGRPRGRTFSPRRAARAPQRVRPALPAARPEPGSPQQPVVGRPRTPVAPPPEVGRQGQPQR